MFAFADVTVGLLFKVGLRLMRDYASQIKAGVESPVLDAKNFADRDLDPAAWAAQSHRAPVRTDHAEIANSVHQR